MQTNVIPFAKYKFPLAPRTQADRLEENRLQIIEWETAFHDLNRQYERAIVAWDVFGAFALQQNGMHLKKILEDLYFDRDALMDGVG